MARPAAEPEAQGLREDAEVEDVVLCEPGPRDVVQGLGPEAVEVHRRVQEVLVRRRHPRVVEPLLPRVTPEAVPATAPGTRAPRRSAPPVRGGSVQVLKVACRAPTRTRTAPHPDALRPAPRRGRAPSSHAADA